MILPGHLSGGYLAVRALLDFSHASFSNTQTIVLIIIGTIFGEGPDVDLFIFYINQISSKKNKRNNHRTYITHTPIFWLCASLIVVIFGWLYESLFIQYIGWAILVGSFSHLILDSIEFGICWLWPFSKRRFCLREVTDPEIEGVRGSIPYYRKLIKKTAFRQITTYVEVFITIVALWVAFH